MGRRIRERPRQLRLLGSKRCTDSEPLLLAGDEGDEAMGERKDENWDAPRSPAP